MKGVVDEFGRALLPLQVKAVANALPQELAVWVDTAFDGDLVLPVTAIGKLGLTQSALVRATLADGSSTVLETFACLVEWFDKTLEIQAIANQGLFPLLGIGLLRGHELVVDYRAGIVAVN